MNVSAAMEIGLSPPPPPGSANCQIDRDALRWLNFANYTATKYIFGPFF